MLFTSYIERTHSADGSSNTLMILRNIKRNLLHKQHLTRFVDYGQCICAHMWSQIVNVICGKCAVCYIWDILRNYSSGKREPLKCDQCVGVTTSTEKYFWINFHATYGLFHTFRSFWSKLSTLTEKLSLENILRISKLVARTCSHMFEQNYWSLPQFSFDGMSESCVPKWLWRLSLLWDDVSIWIS